MGQEILYCFKCQERVTSGDLDSSNALRFGNRVACKKCVPDLIATLSPQEQKELVARVQSPAERRGSGFTPRPRPAAPSTRRTKKASSGVWIAVAVVGIAVVVGVVVFAMSGSPDPLPKDPPKPVSKGPEENSRERAAREAVAKAKAVPSSNLEGQIAAFAEALKVTDGTSHHREAKEMHEGLLEMRRKALVRELAAVDERAKATLQKEEFGAAVAIYEAIRSLRAEPEWKSMVDAKIVDVRKAVEAAYGPLKEQASQAREKGAEDDVKRIRERVSRWGLPDRAADLDAHLQTVASPPPAAVDGRPWTPLFNGKTLDFLTGKGEGAWLVENGAIVHVPGRTNSAQTKRTYSNGELRARFEHRGLTDFSLGVRQGQEGSIGVAIGSTVLKSLEGNQHEIHISFKGGEVTATLDGRALPLQKYGKGPLHGHIQFNARGEYCIIKSLEYREEPLYDGLVGWWTFDLLKDGLAPDSSGNLNHGKVLEGGTSVPGRLGNSIQLDGRLAHMSTPSSPSLDVTGPFTITLWVKPKSDNRIRGLVEKWDGDPKNPPDISTGYFLRLNQAGNVQFVIPAPGDNDAEVRTPDTLAPDVWTFVAAVFDGTSLKAYLNGKLNKSVSSTVAPRSGNAPFRIGMAGGGGPHYFGGEIDDVRLYNRPLAPDEILQLAK